MLKVLKLIPICLTKRFRGNKLSCCIIKYIEKREPCGTVRTDGNKPSIRYLEHFVDIDVEPSDAEFQEFERVYRKYKKSNEILI